MPDRIPSDHDALHTVRATLVRSGGMDRPKVVIPDDEADRFPADEIVRVVADETEYRARIETPLTDDGREIRGLYETPSQARNPGDAENRLRSWLDGTGIEFDQSVLVDVVEAGFKYGLREPGERVVYEATESPDESLSSIAENLEG